jgi:hypothetical protein
MMQENLFVTVWIVGINSMSKFKYCPFCGQSAVEDEDWGWKFTCFHCGHEFEMESYEPLEYGPKLPPKIIVGPPMPKDDMANWSEALRQAYMEPVKRKLNDEPSLIAQLLKRRK